MFGNDDVVSNALNPSFIKLLTSYSLSFSDSLRANEVYRFRSLAPWRFYYGEVDEAVDARFAPIFAELQRIMGANAVAINTGATADHRGTFLVSLIDQLQWFRSLL